MVVLEDRVGRQATLVTLQLPLENWQRAVGDSALADAIVDRMVHHAHCVQLKAGSKRKTEFAPPQLTAAKSKAQRPSCSNLTVESRFRSGRVEKTRVIV